MDELIKELAEGLERAEERLEEADRLLERGADRTTARQTIRSALAALRTSGENVRRVLEALENERRGAESNGAGFNTAVERRVADHDGDIDVEVEAGIEPLDPDETERVCEVARMAVDCIASVGADGELRVEIRRDAEEIVLTVEPSGDSSNVPKFDGSTEQLRSLRESVRTNGGELEIQTSWKEGTALEIRLDGETAPG